MDLRTGGRGADHRSSAPISQASRSTEEGGQDVVITPGLVSWIASTRWFQDRGAPHALLDSDLRIRAVNEAFERASGQLGAQVLGELLGDAFPPNPAAPGADGVARSTRSLLRTLQSGRPDWMELLRYDVPDPGVPGGFRYKVWLAVNVPVSEDGQVVAVLSHAQDVSDGLSTDRQRAASGYVPQRAAAAAERLQRQFPSTPAATVRGILTDSHRVVLASLGVLDTARAVDLARLRMEVRTRVPARREPDDELAEDP